MLSVMSSRSVFVTSNDSIPMISSRVSSLINLLADGRFHSGEVLGRTLGVSRAAVWNNLSGLEKFGLEVFAVSGKGYRLATPFAPLEREAILRQLEVDSLPLLCELEIFPELDSTNQYLLKAAVDDAPSGSACLAEFQHSGRGRRGRNWVSPYGSNVALSLLWRFHDGTSRLGALSLAVAVALMRCLNELGLGKAGIKWPNDILVDGRKLAGILLDVAGESNGPCHVVIGVGLNVRLPESAATAIEQAWTDLWQEGIQTERNIVAGRLLHHLLSVVAEYQKSGLEAFRTEWNQWDLTRDRAVTIYRGDNTVRGVARGIDERGMLLVEHGGELAGYASGEVSLRTQEQ